MMNNNLVRSALHTVFTAVCVMLAVLSVYACADSGLSVLRTAAYTDTSVGAVKSRLVDMDLDNAANLIRSNSELENRETYLRFCNTWTTDNASDVLAGAVLYSETDSGKFYKLTDSFIYIPNNCSASTHYLVYFAGGCGGWILRQDWAWTYILNYDPNCIAIFYKDSGVYCPHEKSSRTEELLKGLASLTKEAPQDITVVGSSNGGYTTFYLAADLYNDCAIVTKNILILDMGLQWGKEGVLISESDAGPLLKMGTTVYHFGRSGEVFKMPGAKQFASYGVKLVEVVCKGAGHDQITSDAFRTGALSWAIGESTPLDQDWYKMTNVNF